MTFMIRGVSTVMTVNVKVAPATHEAPFSPCGRRVGEEGDGHDFHDPGYLGMS